MVILWMNRCVGKFFQINRLLGFNMQVVNMGLSELIPSTVTWLARVLYVKDWLDAKR